MHYLLIDQGNTRCKMAIQKEGHLFETYIVRECTPEALEYWGQEMRLDFASMAVIFSSVGRRNTSELFDYLRSSFAMALILDEDTPLPLQGCRYDRKQIGIDRLVVAIASLDYLSPEHTEALVIDIGTAITYDKILASGIFVGGNISPGPVARLDALHRATSRLPQVDLPDEWSLCGTTTREAISSGVMQGIVYEIQGYINAQSAQTAIFLTGGIALNFATRLKNVTFVTPNLMMEGLNKILDFHVHNDQ